MTSRKELVSTTELRFETPIIRSGLQPWLLRTLFDRGQLSKFLETYKRHALSALHPDKHPGDEHAFKALNDAMEEMRRDPSVVTEASVSSIAEVRDSLYRANRTQLNKTQTALADAQQDIQKIHGAHATEIAQIHHLYADRISALEDLMKRNQRDHRDDIATITLQHHRAKKKLQDMFDLALPEIGALFLLHKAIRSMQEETATGVTYLRVIHVARDATLQNMLDEYTQPKDSIPARPITLKNECERVRVALSQAHALSEEEFPRYLAKRSDDVITISQPTGEQTYHFTGSMSYAGLGACLRANHWETAQKALAYIHMGVQGKGMHRRIFPYLVDAVIPGNLLIAQPVSSDERTTRGTQKRYEIFLPLDVQTTAFTDRSSSETNTAAGI